MKQKTLPSFLEFSYPITSLIREYGREVENKQKVSEASKSNFRVHAQTQ